MDVEQSRSRGRKVVGLSIPLLLLCVGIAVAARYYGVSTVGTMLALLLIGCLLTIPLLWFYRTGEQKYVGIFFVGYLVPIILFSQALLPTSVSTAESMLTVVFYGACLWVGPLLTFALFRRRVLGFIEPTS